MDRYLVCLHRLLLWAEFFILEMQGLRTPSGTCRVFPRHAARLLGVVALYTSKMPEMRHSSLNAPTLLITQSKPAFLHIAERSP